MLDVAAQSLDDQHTLSHAKGKSTRKTDSKITTTTETTTHKEILWTEEESLRIVENRAQMCYAVCALRMHGSEGANKYSLCTCTSVYVLWVCVPVCNIRQIKCHSSSARSFFVVERERARERTSLKMCKMTQSQFIWVFFLSSVHAHSAGIQPNEHFRIWCSFSYSVVGSIFYVPKRNSFHSFYDYITLHRVHTLHILTSASRNELAAFRMCAFLSPSFVHSLPLSF